MSMVHDATGGRCTLIGSLWVGGVRTRGTAPAPCPRHTQNSRPYASVAGASPVKSLADFSILTVRAPLLPVSDGCAFGRARVKWGLTPELVSRSEVERCEWECLPFASGGSHECGAYSRIMRSAIVAGCTRTGGQSRGAGHRVPPDVHKMAVGVTAHILGLHSAQLPFPQTDDRQIAAKFCVSSSALGNPGL